MFFYNVPEAKWYKQVRRANQMWIHWFPGIFAIYSAPFHPAETQYWARYRKLWYPRNLTQDEHTLFFKPLLSVVSSIHSCLRSFSAEVPSLACRLGTRPWMGPTYLFLVTSSDTLPIYFCAEVTTNCRVRRHSKARSNEKEQAAATFNSLNGS